MATTLNLLNKVLQGLRETTLGSGETSLSDTYHKVLLQFINQAKEEVEESWDWEELRSTVVVTGVASTNSHELISSGASDTTVSNVGRLLYKKTRFGRVPQVWDTTDATSAYILWELSDEQMRARHLGDANDEVTQPTHFALRNTSTSAGNKTLDIWPTPSGVRTWTLRMFVPQAELSETDLTTVLAVPARPVWERVLFNAVQERGEELGRPGSSLDRQATASLAEAIAAQQYDDETTSYPDTLACPLVP